MPAGRPLLTALLRALPVGLLLTAASRQLPHGEWWWRTTVLGTLNIGAFFALLIEGAPPALTAQNWAGAGWLALIGTGLAYNLWFRGIERLPVTAVTFLGLLSPVVATALGWSVLGQALTTPQLSGAVLVVAAVAIPQIRNGPFRPALHRRQPHQAGGRGRLGPRRLQPASKACG